MTPLLYLVPAAVAAYALLGKKKTPQPGTTPDDRVKQLLAVEAAATCGEPQKLAWLLSEYQRLGDNVAVARVRAKQKLCLEGLTDPRKQKLAQLAAALGGASQSCDVRALQLIESEYASLGELRAVAIVRKHIARCSGPSVAPPSPPKGESKAEAIARLTRASAVAMSKGDVATLRAIAAEYRRMGEYDAARYVDGLITRLTAPPPPVAPPPPPTIVLPPSPDVVLPPITPPFVPPVAPPPLPPPLPPILPPVLPPVAPPPPEAPGRDAAMRLVAHLRGRRKGTEDRKRVAAFQRLAGLKDDGLYGPGTATAVGSFGIVPAPVLYWPKSWWKAKKSWNKYVSIQSQKDSPRAAEWLGLRVSV